MRAVTHGELFAGISGFGLGFERAGIETIWHVEIDDYCQEVLRHHCPGTLLLSDVLECGKHNLPSVDIISFGTPCQDLSVAGKREGLKGERSGLFFEGIRIVDELQPTFAVWENVPGAFSSNFGRDFAAVLSAFRQCGARDIAWRVLDAQYCGVAQRRRRVFVIADFGGERAAEILFESTRSPWDSAPSRETGEGIARTIAAGAHPSGFNGYDAERGNLVAAVDVRNLREEPDGISGTLQHKKSSGYSLNYQNPVIVRHALSGNNQRNDPDGEHFVVAFQGKASSTNSMNPSNVVPSLNVAKAGGTVVAIQHSIIGRKLEAGAQGKGWREDGTTWTLDGRADADAVAGHFGVRRLTPLECERLQGFPDTWTAVNGMSDSARYRMLGNAVAVPVAKWIGQRIAEF